MNINSSLAALWILVVVLGSVVSAYNTRDILLDALKRIKTRGEVVRQISKDIQKTRHNIRNINKRSIERTDYYREMVAKYKAEQQSLASEKHLRRVRRQISSGIGNLLLQVTEIITLITDQNSALNIGFNQMGACVEQIGGSFATLFSIVTDPAILNTPNKAIDIIILAGKQFTEGFMKCAQGLDTTRQGIETILSFASATMKMITPSTRGK